MVIRMNFRSFTSSSYIRFLKYFTKKPIIGMVILRKLANFIYRVNSSESENTPWFHFYNFSSKNVNLGLKIKILKFLGIQPIHIHLSTPIWIHEIFFILIVIIFDWADIRWKAGPSGLFVHRVHDTLDYFCWPNLRSFKASKI